MPPTLDLVRAYLNTHPDSAADALETVTPEAAAELLAELPPDDAAVIAMHMVPGFTASCLIALDPVSAGKILDRMSARQAAMVLRHIDRTSRGPLVALIGRARRAHVSLILRQPMQIVAAWIDTQVPALRAEDTVAIARDRVAQADGAFDRVFIVDAGYRLLGAVPVRILLQQAPETNLSDLMEPQPDRLMGSLLIHVALDDPSWQKSDLQPVVDASGKFLGTIRHADLRRAYLPDAPHATASRAENSAIELTHMVYLALAETMNVTLGQIRNHRNPAEGDR